ncbi:hypothetical protein ACS8E3_10095 [Psychrobacter sp. 2Y5]|uniref:hypothetical protein n=1 Tax=unclassified Psychrobacter TaxID=196806 RepID=UPI003F47499E
MFKLYAKALIAIAFILSLWLPISAQASNHSYKNSSEEQMRLQQLAREEQAQLQSSNRERLKQQNEKTNSSNLVTTSGLDKEKQIEELAKTLVYIYNVKEFFVDVWQNPKSPYIRILDFDKKICMKNEFNEPQTIQLFEAIARDYIESQPAEKNHKDLKLLIDSELSYELHSLSHASLIGDDDYHYIIQLHSLQKPKLAVAIREIVNNPNYSELAKLIAVNVNSQNTVLGQVLNTAANKCDFKLNKVD